MTGFSRFLLFLLIFAPVAYFSASYITGQNLQDMLNNEKPKTEIVSEEINTETESISTQNEVEVLKKELKEKEVKIQELESELASSQKEIADLKIQISTLKELINPQNN